MFHAITLLCALGFVGIKSVEYHDKFMHYEIVQKDGKFADGHFRSAAYVAAGSTEQVVMHSFKGMTFERAEGANKVAYTLASVTLNGHIVDDERLLYDLHAAKKAAPQPLAHKTPPGIPGEKSAQLI